MARLSPRERVTLALDHKPTDRVPIAMVCSGLTPPAYGALAQYLAAERQTTVEEYLRPLLDIEMVGPAYVGPTLAPGEDIWGVRREAVSYGAGSYDEIAHYPLAGATRDSLAEMTWPTTEWFDYRGIPEAIARARRGGDPCLMAPGGNPFETAWYMRGLEQLLIDFATDAEFAHALLERVCGFFVAHVERILEAGGGAIDLAFTADDLGGQEGLLLSLSMWEEFLKPYHERLNATIHRYGARVIYHTDGAIMEAVPGLVAAGVDILQALQFDARGMDPVRLKQDHGAHLGFQGGVSVQSTLPFGTEEAVRQEVIERIDVLGAGGGYILGSSHAIQAGTPPQNIVAMFDAAVSHPVG